MNKIEPTPVENIHNALEVLELPMLITREDIKKQYYSLSKKNHPDLGGEEKNQEQINHAYRLLMKYVEEFRYTFDEKEIYNQLPGADHAHRFRP